MQILKTPDVRFVGLPDFRFKPRYLDVRSEASAQPLRLHYLDEGPADGAPVVLLHGEPSWCYLYRKIIPLLAAEGHRVLAPDLIGFGRSDKPAQQSEYTFERHVAWVADWLQQLGLSGIALFCQDWGGLIGLRLVAKYPDRFNAVVAANTGLPAGGGQITAAFKIWLAFSRFAPRLPVGWLVSKGTVRGLSSDEKRAYDAPFPDETFKAGARIFPALVPITDAHPSVAESKAAWQVLERFDRPFITAFSDRDPITRGGDVVFQSRIPGAKGQPHTTIKNAGHFLQEDQPEAIAELISATVMRVAANAGSRPN